MMLNVPSPAIKRATCRRSHTLRWSCSGRSKTGLVSSLSDSVSGNSNVCAKKSSSTAVASSVAATLVGGVSGRGGHALCALTRGRRDLFERRRCLEFGLCSAEYSFVALIAIGTLQLITS